MNWYEIFAVCGMIGAGLCICGDLLLDLKGSDNRKLGKYGFIDSAWDHMDGRRFLWSILFAGVGTPLAALGFLSMSYALYLAKPGFGMAYFLISICGVAGSFFIHTFICLLPVLYQKIAPVHGFAEAEALLNTAYKAVLVPFWGFYLALVIVPSCMVAWALGAGYLGLSPWMILLTPLCLMAFGILLDKLDHRHFCDLPVVITPSLGLCMMSLMAYLSLQ